MKRVVAALSLTLLIGCGGPPETKHELSRPAPGTLPPGYKLHTAPDNAFTISLPVDWEVAQVAERIDSRKATQDAGMAVFGQMERSSLVARKQDGLAAGGATGQSGSRGLVSALRLTLYDAENYDRFRKESYAEFLDALKADGAKTEVTRAQLPVGTADVHKASWSAQGEAFVLLSYFLRDKDDRVYVIHIGSAGPPGSAEIDAAPIVESFRPGE